MAQLHPLHLRTRHRRLWPPQRLCLALRALRLSARRRLGFHLSLEPMMFWSFFRLPRTKTFPFCNPLCVHGLISLFPFSDRTATHQKLAKERIVPCSIDCRRHVRLPLEFTVSLPILFFFAGGRHTCRLCRRRPRPDSTILFHVVVESDSTILSSTKWPRPTVS